MGRKIFVSYKYGDDNVFPLFKEWYRQTTVRTYVDKLEEYFDSTDEIYKGESDDEDLSNYGEDYIWEKLKDRIYDSSVTIVMISPTMKIKNRSDKSQWIPWEVSYSIKEITRNDRVSRSNAMLAIVLPDKNNSYEYFLKNNQCNTCKCRTLMTDTLFTILSKNMFNKKEKQIFNCSTGIASNIYTGDVSYICSVKWADFIVSPKEYIEKAIELKENISEYEISKVV